MPPALPVARVVCVAWRARARACSRVGAVTPLPPALTCAIGIALSHLPLLHPGAIGIGDSWLPLPHYRVQLGQAVALVRVCVCARVLPVGVLCCGVVLCGVLWCCVVWCSCHWRLGYQLAGIKTGRQWALAGGSWLAPWHVPAYAIWGGSYVSGLPTRLACGFALGDTEAGPIVSRWPSRRFTLLRHSAQLRSALCASPSRTCAIGIGIVCISLLRFAVAIGFGGRGGYEDWNASIVFAAHDFRWWLGHATVKGSARVPPLGWSSSSTSGRELCGGSRRPGT